MDISKVTQEDGRMCAQLINLLKAGKWELSGPDIDAHSNTVRWVHFLATKMAEQLRSSKVAAESVAPATQQRQEQSMRIKARGSLPASNAGKQKNSRKK